MFDNFNYFPNVIKTLECFFYEVVYVAINIIYYYYYYIVKKKF